MKTMLKLLFAHFQQTLSLKYTDGRRFNVMALWHIACFLAVLLSHVLIVQSFALPQHVVSKDEYDRANQALLSHVRDVSALPGFRTLGKPLVYLHLPGSKIYGTVLIFHGFSLTAAASRQQAEYLYNRNFSVIAFNLAGHAQTPKYWPYTLLRSSAGAVSARSALFRDTFFGPLLNSLSGKTTDQVWAAVTRQQTSGGLLVPRIKNVFKRSLGADEYAKVLAAIRLLTPGLRLTGFQKLIRKYFISSHSRYQSDPFVKLSLVSSLPGPLYAVGFSLGTIHTINIAAQSKALSKIVLLAPYFARFDDPLQRDIWHFYFTLGSLDILDVTMRSPFGIMRVPSRTLPPVLFAGSLAATDEITSAVRGSTKTLCIMAEDDRAIDVRHSAEVCRSKLGGRVYMYPKKFNLDHSILPELGSKWGGTLLEEIANYLINDKVNEKNLMTKKRSPGI